MKHNYLPKKAGEKFQAIDIGNNKPHHCGPFIFDKLVSRIIEAHNSEGLRFGLSIDVFRFERVK